MASPPNLILLTGASGWLGKRFLRLLANRDLGDTRANDFVSAARLRCLVPPGDDVEMLKALHPGAEVLTGDLRNPADCEHFCARARGALLFHAAGIIHPARVADFYSINVQGARNLLASAVTAGIWRMVAVSSNSPLGCNPHPDHRFDELSPYNPYMNYGRSKMMMEGAVREANDRTSMETVIVRPPWFYGPDQPHRQTLFFTMIRNGSVPIVGSGNNLRSMCYVDNLCHGLILAGMTTSARGQTYWIADRRPYTMNEIMDTVEKLLENEFNIVVKHKRFRLPGLVSELALAADRMIQATGLYNSRIHVLSEMNKTIACSITKAEKELGYRPPIALEEGMRRSLRWCLESGLKI